MCTFCAVKKHQNCVVQIILKKVRFGLKMNPQVPLTTTESKANLF